MNRKIKDLGKALLKKKLYILSITLILLFTGVFYTLTNVKCVASQKFLVGENENRIETYKELIKGSTVLEEAINNLGASISVSNLSKQLEVTTIENTNMFEVKISGEEETTLRNYSSEIANVFLKKVHEIYENAEIYQIDNSAEYVHTGNPALRGIGFGMIGFVLSSLFFAGCFLVDTKIKSCKEIEEITGLKTLISIPNMKMMAKKRLNMRSLRAHKSEIFKTLMTNIQFVNRNQLDNKTILVTSAKEAEGKSYVASNLAIEFAKVGKKVILIDSDMRRGRLAKIFNLPNDLGFSNYLSNLDGNGNVIHDRITRFIHDTEIKNLNVITAGNVPPNPIELLKTEKIQELIKDLKVFYDVILFDAVSILEAPEAEILSKECDLTLLLASYGNTKREELSTAYEQMKKANSISIGVALNKIPDRRLKKKVAMFQINFKQLLNKVTKKIKAIWNKVKKISKLGKKIKSAFQFVFGLLVLGGLKIRKMFIHLIHEVRKKTQNVKEYIKNYKAKREKIKLIEAGSMILENEEENNIIKEVFESEMAKLETENEIAYQKKLDEMKTNLDEKSSALPEAIEEKVRPVQTRQTKSKFDLMREQQEKREAKTENVQLKIEESPEENIKEEKIEKVEKIEVDLEENRQEEIQKKHEALKQKQRMERERKEEEKRARQEEIENFQDIDFAKQENLTEEMIRKQVEMDEMVRLAEKEEEEEQFRKQQMKLKEKSKKRKERMEKFQNMINSMKNWKDEYSNQMTQRRMIKNEERMERESEKNENRVRIAQVKEEKRAYREMEKQRQKEELRINEELQEDNLYPRPRM